MRWTTEGRRSGRSPGDHEAGPATARRFLLRRLAIAVVVVLLAASLVFAAIHLGPRAPADAEPGDDDETAALEEKKEAFGLHRPLHVRYVDYLTDMATLEFGESWTSRYLDGSVRHERITDVNVLLFQKLLPRTAWLWLWSLLLAAAIGLPLGVGLGLSEWSLGETGAAVSGAVLRGAAVFMTATFIKILLTYSNVLLFGFDWTAFLVETATVTGEPDLRTPTDPRTLLVATKQVFPPALAVAVGLAGTAVRVGERAANAAREGPGILGVRARGGDRGDRAAHALRPTALPLSTILSTNVAVLLGATLFVEVHFNMMGVGLTFVEAVGHGDYTTAQAIAFLFVLLLVGVRLLEAVVQVLLVGPPAAGDRAMASWTGRVDAWGAWDDEHRRERLTSLQRRTAAGLRGRLRAAPKPAIAWIAAGAVLVALQLGAVLDALAFLAGVAGLPDVPTLLSAELVPNEGHRTPGGGWTGTAFGLPAAYAWGLRVALVYLYALAWAGWVWLGYRIYRSVYREQDRTPTDAALARFRRSRWGVFGLVVVFTFVVAALFAPTLAPGPVDPLDEDRPHEQEGSNDRVIRYLEDGEIRETTANLANYGTESQGISDTNVGPMSYDRFDRFHPFGTAYHGNDLLTAELERARATLLVGTIGTGVALLLTVLTAVMAGIGPAGKGVGTAFAAEATAGLPLVPVAFLVVDQFEPSIPSSLVGTVLLTAILGVLVWPLLWRTLQAPLEHARTAGRVEAARSAGATRRRRLRRHVLPSLARHLLPYVPFAFLGTIVAYGTITTLWGGSVTFYTYSILTPVIGNNLATLSWHTEVLPGTVALLLFVGLHALADGLRYALDPAGAQGVAAPGETMAAGGAG